VAKEPACARLLLSVRPGSISTPEVIAFLRNLRRHVHGPVVVVWDGLPCHRSRETQRHIAAQASWLTVERFPAYAPKLNPLEYLWSALKSKDMANYSRTMRRARRRDMGSSFIKKAGLISKAEYLLLCKDQ